MRMEKLPAIAASILGTTLAGEGLADRLPRLAQYAVPSVPGGLPGMAVPPPARAPALPAPALPAPSPSAPSLSVPTLRAPEAAPPVAVPPPPPPAARAPEMHGAEVCDCHAEVDVPVYANGQIVGWRRERHPTGRSPQCCPR
jgi:hypothetical protein